MANDMLGGYRVVRKLGEGARAELFLAHPAASYPAPDPTHAGSAAAPVVLKVARAGTPDTSTLAEIEALSRAAGEHVVGLVDVLTDRDRTPVLALQRLPGGSLARLLRDRERLAMGEAITILAPLADAVDRAHRSGVVHGSLRAEAVLFDGAGAPVLACFGRASLIEPGLPPAALEAEVGVVADIRAFGNLAAVVLGLVPGAGAPRDARDAVLASLAVPGGLREFGAKVFELGEPSPVLLGASTGADPAVPARVPLDASGDLPERPSTSVAAGEELPRLRPGLARSTVLALGLPGWIDRLVPPRAQELVAKARARVPNGLPGIAAAGATVARTVRPRVWIMAGAVAVALLAALVLVPQGDGGSPDPAEAGVANEGPASDGVEGNPDYTEVADDPVAGDDPLAALTQLLRLREQCLIDLSVLCLDAVGQAGSAALASDIDQVTEIRAGAELPSTIVVTPAAMELVERLGDSAIVNLGPDSKPASVLLMKGEAGWRIRDYLEE
jgi:hypothetical protein